MITYTLMVMTVDGDDDIIGQKEAIAYAVERFGKASFLHIEQDKPEREPEQLAFFDVERAVRVAMRFREDYCGRKKSRPD